MSLYAMAENFLLKIHFLVTFYSRANLGDSSSVTL